MFLSKNDKIYFYAFVFSLAGHSIFILSMVFLASSSKVKTKEVVYTVSLEGGKVLGSLSASASELNKNEKTPIKKSIKKVEKKTTAPKKAEIQEKKLEPVKKQEEKVSIAEKKEEVKPKKIVKKIVEKKIIKEEKKIQAKPKQVEKKVVKKSSIDIEKEYQKEMQKYLEKTSSVGSKTNNQNNKSNTQGSGGGAGILKSPEFFQYYGLLERHIRSGWNWHDLRQSYMAIVSFKINPDGRISGIYLVESSGNNLYDQSVLRAVKKASPVPIPPKNVYADFKKVEMDFTPE